MSYRSRYKQMREDRARARRYDGARAIEGAKPDDADLGPLRLLPGVWQNKNGFEQRGWNLIALPFFQRGSARDYRLLLNRYDETLKFDLVDKGVPNRGLARFGANTTNLDQLLVTLDYEQVITQTDAVDRPVSGKVGKNGSGIHHEPGLWLYHLNDITTGLDIARLGTIPHGNSVLALGRSDEFDGVPRVPDVSALPIGVDQDPDNGYLEPYFHFTVKDAGGTPVDDRFAGLFDTLRPTKLLRDTNATIQNDPNVEAVRTTQLHVNTAFPTGGIVNIPFIVSQANATEMESFFWIMDIRKKRGERVLLLQYLQIVMLDFFTRPDGLSSDPCCPCPQPGRIRWPHISINTMVKVG